MMASFPSPVDSGREGGRAPAVSAIRRVGIVFISPAGDQSAAIERYFADSTVVGHEFETEALAVNPQLYFPGPRSRQVRQTSLTRPATRRPSSYRSCEGHPCPRAKTYRQNRIALMKAPNAIGYVGS